MRRKKIVLGILLFIVVILAGFGAFVYKVTVGWPIFEQAAPTLILSNEDINVVVFSKTNGYRHGEGIDAAEELIARFAEEEGWNLIVTENGAIHDRDILKNIDVIIWNNVTGKVLLDEQRLAMQEFVEGGGSFIGLHGAGDFSHHWDWYEEKLIGASFSHHTLHPQLQEGTVYPQGGDAGSDESWVTMEEWYVFNASPRLSGAEVLWNLQESDINPNGNLGFFVRDKDWGMGADHPMVWRNTVGRGKTLYSAFGHNAINYEHKVYQDILKGAILWAIEE